MPDIFFLKGREEKRPRDEGVIRARTGPEMEATGRERQSLEEGKGQKSRGSANNETPWIPMAGSI